MFGIRSKTSRTPSFFRKANKVMKWFLAVPDDPELKTWSSRRRRHQYSKLDAVSSSLQRQPTNATSSRSPPSQPTTGHGRTPYSQQKEEGTPRSPDHRKDFHLAPNPPVRMQALQQPSFETLGYGSQATSAPIKAGKTNYGQSAASSETGWPTQSRAGGA